MTAEFRGIGDPMSEHNKPKKGKSGKRRKRSKGQKKEKQVREPQKNPVICSMCSKPIEIISTAVSGLESGEIAHLECMAKHYEKVEQVNERQRVLYVGQGSFAVVEYKNAHKQGSFSIVKRITHEDSESSRQLKLAIQDRLPAVNILQR